MKRYRNLDLEAFNHTKAPDGTEHFWVRVEDSPGCGQKRNQAQEVALPSDLRQRVRRLMLRQVTEPGVRELGRDLAALIFPQAVRSFLERSWDRIAEDERLRIRLKLESLALGDLPWEYAYLAYPEGFLTLNRRISLVRYEVMEQARRCTLEPVDASNLRVVLLSANPQGEGYLPLQLTDEMGLTEVTQAEKVTRLYNLFREFALNAYGSVMALLGKQLAQVAADRVVAWVNDLQEGKHIAELLETLYQTKQTGQELEQLVLDSPVPLERFVASLDGVQGLGAAYQHQIALAGKLLKGLRLFAGVPGAALPQGRLLLAAANIILGGYFVMAGVDFVDAQRLAWFDRVPGVRTTLEGNLAEG